MAKATCDDCGKTFSVRDSHRDYTCRECGGVVRAADSTSSDDADEARQIAARAAYKDARTKAVVLLLIYGSVCSLFGINLIFQMLVRAMGGAFFAVNASLTVGFLVSGIGAMRVRREPMLWSTAIASVSTFCAGFAIVNTMSIAPFLAVVSALVIVGVWAAWFIARKVNKTLLAFPEFDYHGNRKFGSGRAAKKAVREKQGRRKEVFVMTAAGAGALVLVVLSSVFATSAEGPAARTDALREQWNEGEIAAIEKDFEKSDRRHKFGRLVERLATRGWNEKPPQLGEPRIEDETSTTARIALPVEEENGGEIVAHWKKAKKKGWHLHKLELPKVRAKVGPEMTVSRFSEAFNAGDIDAIVALAEEENEDRFRRVVTRGFEKRGWNAKRPQLGLARMKVGNAKSYAYFEVGNGELRLTLRYSFPDWHLTGLRWPKSE